MSKTYTFTARSARDPARVATFTLHDHTMTVDVGVPVEQIKTAIEGREEVERDTKPWLKPLALSVLEGGTGAFPVADLHATAGSGGLRVTAWVRAGGLRLVPIRLRWVRVDNPEGAEEFVREIEERRARSEKDEGFLALFDYWATWLVLGAFFGWWFIRKRSSQR